MEYVFGNPDVQSDYLRYSHCNDYDDWETFRSGSIHYLTITTFLLGILILPIYTYRN